MGSIMLQVWQVLSTVNCLPMPPDEVVKAYEAQYAADMECFLHARVQEVVRGGLIALIVCGRPNDTPLPFQTHQNILHDLLGSCLMDMARKVGNEQLPLEFNSYHSCHF